MKIDGRWKVRYSESLEAPFQNETGEPDEQGEVVLDEGKVSGSDIWGGVYDGTYQLEGNRITAEVIVSADPHDPEFRPVFEDVPVPFTLRLSGEFNSPNYFSMRGTIVEASGHLVVLNCSRTIQE